MKFDLTEHSHRRLNPLTGEWVIVSPHRTKRPWQGQVEDVKQANLPKYDPECYLCPGNKRARENINPVYDGVFVFDNDFAALTPESTDGDAGSSGILIAERERGVSRVVCFSADHGLTIARMDVEAITDVANVWADQYNQLASLPYVRHVQIFENRGEMMGASNPHPHCQIWASETVPNEPAKEIKRQADYADKHGSCLLCDYLAIEIEAGERIVCANEEFVALVPFWAVYPFEVMILGRHHRATLSECGPSERRAFAEIIKRVTTRYDNLFKTPFPYSMGIHQAPTDGETHDSSHFHTHFFPPLLRSATVRKFLVGFEILGSPQRDLTPEQAALRLRELSEEHYTR